MQQPSLGRFKRNGLKGTLLGAGGGKSFTCLTKNLDGIYDPGFRCAILRRYEPELKKPGGLIDVSKSVYSDFTRIPYKTQAKQWVFESGATVTFSAISCDDDLGSWQGSQMSRILVDEAGDKWTEKQILFLASRLRSEAKMHHQLILTANPDINSFLKSWVDFCLDPDTGVPVPGTEHRIRWMITLDSQVLWADSPEESFELYGKPRGMVYAKDMTGEEIKKHHPSKLFMPKSFRFIPTGVFDNPYLLPPKNNTYLADLLSQPRVNQLKFLHGSWTARAEHSGMFNRDWVQIVDHPPSDATARVRSYDLAGSVPSEANNMRCDWTAGVKMSRDKFGIYYVEDVVRFQKLSDGVLKEIVKVSQDDGQDTQVTIPRDPGAGARTANQFYTRVLAEHGVPVKSVVVSGHSGKAQRFSPFASLAEGGSVRLVRGKWNEEYLRELEYYEAGNRNQLDDQVDATSDAFNTICKNVTMPSFSIPELSQASPIPTM